MRKKGSLKPKSKFRRKTKTKVRKPKRIMHYSYLKKVLLSDTSKPNGVKENPFVVKNRSISNRVNSIIIGIQQPIIQMLGLTKDTWYKQYCDPVSKTIFLEVYSDYEGV